MKFTLPIEALPQEEQKRYQILHDYFCDQRGHSYQENNHWNIESYWPPKADYFVDPNILEGLQWWSPSLTTELVHQQVKKLDGFQLSLNDSWTLFSWSEWLSKKMAMNKSLPEELIILHIDYHNDLMSPRISFNEKQYTDLLTGNIFDIKKPKTVKNAILSGAIGVGSFIVPFIHKFNKVHFRHLCNGPLTLKMGSVRQLEKAWENDTLISTTSIRPKVKFVEKDITEIKEEFINYDITNLLEMWIANLPCAPILLHIDMDYFNCRYDGDSDWQNQMPRYDPNLSVQLQKMEEIFSAIIKAGLRDNIEDISVALSPGFFPVEFWDEGIRKISELVKVLRT